MDVTTTPAKKVEYRSESEARRPGTPQARRHGKDDTIVNVEDSSDVLAAAHGRAQSATTADHGYFTPDPSVTSFLGPIGQELVDVKAQRAFLDSAIREGLKYGIDITKLQAKKTLAAATISTFSYVSTADPATAKEAQAVNDALDEYAMLLQQTRDSCKTYWPNEFRANLGSGAMAFLLCFGPGTLLASALEMPVAGWATSTVLWALTERFIPMLRKTSWKSYSADIAYPSMAKMIQRAARDAVRSCKGLPPKTYPQTVGEKIQFFTAREILDRTPKGQAWREKFATDDLPYYFYSLCYGLRYTAIAWFALPSTSPISLATLLLAGTMAGACTASAMQHARRQQYVPPEGKGHSSGQSLVQDREKWAKKVKIFQAHINLLDAQGLGDSLDETGNCLEEGSSRNQLLEKLAIAKIRAHGLYSIGFEIATLFRLKRNPEERRGEVAGKRGELISGTLAKATVLGLSTGFNYVATSHVMKIPGVGASIGGTWMQSVVLIMAFSLRKEVELAYRGLFGLVQGLHDILPGKCQVFSSCLGDEEDHSENNDTTTGIPGSLASATSTQDLLEQAKNEKPAKSSKTRKKRALMTADDSDENREENIFFGANTLPTRHELVGSPEDRHSRTKEKQSQPLPAEGRIQTPYKTPEKKHRQANPDKNFRGNNHGRQPADSPHLDFSGSDSSTD